MMAQVIGKPEELQPKKVVETATAETEPSNGRSILAVPTNKQAELYNMDSLTRVLDDGHTSLPQVLLSLALESDQVLDLDRCRKWLQDFPALARYATVQGVYSSNSTLLILSPRCHLGLNTGRSCLHLHRLRSVGQSHNK
jgi:hypothetical protein